MTRVTALVVAFGASEFLTRCVDSVLDSAGVDVDVVLVDNGGTGDAVDQFLDRAGVRVIRPGRNTGFAEGCNLAAAAAEGEVLALVNPDVIVDPDCLVRLANVAIQTDVGIATASLRTAEDRQLMNSAGNPVHFLGLAWAGGHDEPAARYTQSRPVASASGALCALRRDLWCELDGFEPLYFAYHEDVELSLRCWLSGLPVQYVPDATGIHHYEFSRNTLKLELLERNRWLTLLTVYSTRTLLILGPPILLVELLMLATAAAQGWLPAKLSGYRWLVANRSLIVARRRRVQQDRRCSDRVLATVFAARLAPTNVDRPPGLSLLNVILAGYWWIARRCL